MLSKGRIITHLTYQDGWSSLMAASYDGHVEVLDKLLQHGARVDIQNVVLLLRYSATILLCVSQS